MTAGAGAVDRALVVRAIAALLVADHRTRHEAARAGNAATPSLTDAPQERLDDVCSVPRHNVA